MERRILDVESLEVRADDEGKVKTIAGYAAVFDKLSVVMWGFREKIAPGAFRESLKEDVRALWNHDTNHVLGRTTAGTLRLDEDGHGLKVEIDPPGSAAGFVESIERGDVSQMSFGFKVLEDRWDEDEEGQDIRTLLRVKLYEVSPVAFPAYPDTEVGVRAWLGENPLTQRRGEGLLPDSEERRDGGGTSPQPSPEEREKGTSPRPSPEERENNESDQRALGEIEATQADDADVLRAQAEAESSYLRLRLAAV